MKIEMGESLGISWLKHIKGCQLVQANWKPSKNWTMMHADEITDAINDIASYFKVQFSNDFHDVIGAELDGSSWEIFNQNASIEQLLFQGEIDIVGVSYQDDVPYPYSVEVAFHSNGLNYGNAKETTMKILDEILKNPKNANQLSKMLNLNYKTIIHHTNIMQEHKFITKNKFNKTYVKFKWKGHH